MATIAGVTRVVDVSHHQEDIDVGALQGIDGVIARTAQAKGGKYGTTLDRAYARHKANAARAGKLFTSYFYLGSGLTPRQNAELHASCEPNRAVGVMLDWEEGSGDGDFLKACLSEFRQLGYGVWGTYAPRWYWSAQGSPDLRDVPPLVSSRYKDNLPGPFDSELAGTPDSYWVGYGNNSVRLLQFTSVGRVQPYPNRDLDCNAFMGTRAQLAAWWSPFGWTPTTDPVDLDREEELMERITVTPPNADSNAKRVWLSGGPNAAVIVRPRIKGDGFSNPMWVGDIFAWGNDHVGIGHNPTQTPGYNNKLTSHRRYDLPGAVWADINYSAAEAFEIDIVG
jgi:hypothetical protein